MRDVEYLKNKRLEVLVKIKPICDAFGITNYDYEVNVGGTGSWSETLIINETKICCSCNSMSAIIEELVGYIFVKVWCKERYLGHFKTQTLNIIKQHWWKGIE